MPSYLEASFALAAASLVLAVAIPTPRMKSTRAGGYCLALMVGCAVSFVVALTLIVGAIAHKLPGYVVVTPAIAVLCVSVALSMTMFWMSTAPDAAREGDEEGSDGDEGGGGGGLRPEDEPPRDPGPSDGICWDSFDRDRHAWEAERERVLVDA